MNNHVPKVSVIMPSLNTAEYIEEALRSVVKQTLSDIEVICVDAGSTDGTYNIIQTFARNDDRIRVFTTDIRSYGYQMNLGIDNARGKYIGIVEPDDYVALDMFGDLYEIAEEHQLDIVKADFYRFTTDSETQDMNLVYNRLSFNKKDYGEVFTPLEKLDSFYFVMNTWAGIYNRSFLETHAIRHNETPGASYQDNGFYFQTFAHADRVMIVDRPYYMNRRDNPNSSMKSKEKVDAIRIEYDYIRDRLQEDPNLWEQLKTVHSVKRFDNYLATANRIAPELVKDYLVWASEDMHAHVDAGELDLEQVPKGKTYLMNLLLSNPKKLYRRFYIHEDKDEIALAISRAENAEQRVRDLEGSVSFKVGRAITAFPRAVRDFLKR